MEEIWKDINGYEGLYQVSTLGRVRSLDRVDATNHVWKGKILKQYGSPYLQVNLHKDGKKVAHKIHRLVATAFCKGYQEGYDVNHIDENKHNNRADNLEWVTHNANMKHSHIQERLTNGKKKPVCQYDMSGNLVACYDSAREAARLLGFDQSHISEVCRGEKQQYNGFVWRYK